MQQAHQQQAFGLPASMNGGAVGMQGMHDQNAAHNLALAQFQNKLTPAQFQNLAARNPAMLQAMQPAMSRQLDLLSQQSQHQQNQPPNAFRSFQQQQQQQQHQQQQMQAAMGNQMTANLAQNGFFPSGGMPQMPDGLQSSMTNTLSNQRGMMQQGMSMAQRQDMQASILENLPQKMGLLQAQLQDLRQKEAMLLNNRIGKPEHVFQAEVSQIQHEIATKRDYMSKLQAIARAQTRPPGHM